MDLDQPNTWRIAIPTGLALAKCFGAKVTLTTVLEDTIPVLNAQWSTFADRNALSRAETRLSSLADKFKCGEVMETLVRTGGVRSGILEAADAVEADLIVLASSRPEMWDRVIGPAALHVVRQARCSVMVVRE